MEQIIYGDTLFLVNASMDFLSLFLCCKILYRPVRILPTVLAAVLGGIYGVAVLFLSGNAFIGFLLHVAAAALMCAITLGIDRDLWRATVLFFTVSLVLGGAMTAIISLMNRIGRSIRYNGSAVTVQSDLPPMVFIGIAATAAIVTWGAGRVFRREIRKRRAQVCVVFADREITFSALSDSGNLLYEPISGRPVVVLSYTVLKPLLPNELQPVFADHQTSLLPNIPFSVARRVRLIPARGIGQDGILCALLPDRATVDGKDMQICVACTTQEGGFGGCDAILPASLLA